MKIWLRVMIGTLVLNMLAFGAAPVSAGDHAGKAQRLVTRSLWAFEHFVNDPDIGWFRTSLKDAKAILIVPTLGKAGLIIGGYGGSGCLLARDVMEAARRVYLEPFDKFRIDKAGGLLSFTRSPSPNRAT